MCARASDLGASCQEQRRPAESAREQLERAARRLPDSDLKAAILATLSERRPTVREALAWITILQAPKRRMH
jgi:hypothetical protein